MERLRPYPVTVFCAVTLLIWGNRVWLNWTAPDVDLAAKLALSIPITAFVAAAVVVLVWLLRGADTDGRSFRLVVRTFAGGTVVFWAVRVPMILANDHPLAFDVVHSVLAVVSVVSAGFAWRAVGGAGDASGPGSPTGSRSKRTGTVAVGLLAALALVSCSGGSDDAARTTTTVPIPTSTTIPPDDDLRLNEIQTIGTHNSFHLPTSEKERDLLAAMDAKQAAQRAYGHPPLAQQLGTEGVRQLELDVFADEQGGRYAAPALRTRAGLDPYVKEEPELARPGTKVLHEQDVDYRSVCPTLVRCLQEVKAWSDANPGHVPIAIDIQFKDGPLIFPVDDQVKPEPWNAAAMDRLDAEIRRVFPPESLITPDDVRGSHPTLDAAVRADGWPTLGESRGKVMFLMVNGEPYRSTYLEGHPGLKGRVLFTNATPGQPDASYVGVDDPVENADRIRELVAKGYLVRTRADTPDVQGRTGDTTMRDAALASGAQWISTDYPGPDGAAEQYGTDYLVELPGGVTARCNPVTAPKSCRDEAVEPSLTR